MSVTSFGHKVVAASAAVLLVLAAASCTSKDDTSSSDSSGGDATDATSIDTAALLGPEDQADGTPITLGFVYDGAGGGIDNTSYFESAQATAEYVNEHLGGINGHPIELDGCETGNTPSGGTTCGVQMIDDDVAAVLVTTSAQDAAVFTALGDSGIPYVTFTTAAQEILLTPGASVFTNPFGQIGAPALIAQDEGVDSVAEVIIDVPAATGPIGSIAEPIFADLGMGFSLVPIAASVADHTPQIQQAISDGAGMFVVVGSEDFIANSLRAIDQLGFDGPVLVGGSALTAETARSIPGGVEGTLSLGTTVIDPADEEYQLFEAVLDQYAPDTEPDGLTAPTFQLVLGLQRALDGVDAAVDAASISEALGSMPAAVPLPLGGGVEIQCGAGLVELTPNSCTTGVLRSVLDAEATPQDFELVDTAELN